MKRFNVNKWNNGINDYSMLILTEDDIINETNYCGAGVDILVLPSVCKDISSKYLDTLKYLIKCRNGEIIYV